MGPSWSFIAGLPVGLLAGLALFEAPGAGELSAAALAAGVVLAGAVWWLARRGSWDLDPGARLARGASAGLLALPAIGMLLLGLAPEPLVSLALVVVAIVVALGLALRREAPGAGLVRHGLRMGAALLAFVALLVTVAGISAGLPKVRAALDESLGDAVLDADARVPLGPEVSCEPRVGRVSVLHSAGAHPRRLGANLWFDAAHEGRRQVYRLGLDDGELRCFTCDEPGNNRRPAPAAGGHAVVFDTDRHRTARHPANTEIHAIAAGSARPGGASRRLTHHPLPDDRAIYDPSGIGIVWSSGQGSGFVVRRAAVRSGHGGVILTGERLLAVGGRKWVTPLAWSADGRTLVLGHGHPLRPLTAHALDAATGERTDLGRDLAGAGAVSFSSDASRMAVVATRPSGAQSLIPDALGFLVGRLAAATGTDTAGPGGTEVRIGPSGGELREVDLGDAAAWGEPTGVALSASGTSFVLAQRRPGSPMEERLLQVELVCVETSQE